MAEYIERETLMKRFCERCNEEMSECPCEPSDCFAREVIKTIQAADVEKMSDGYHTFADLYEQRLILSAALAKNNPHAWKSKRHEDGSVPFGGGWFIMGFDTDEGCYTYHYELKDWDLFQCEELDKGKPWDGHTAKDVRRLLSIPADDVAPFSEFLADFMIANGVTVHEWVSVEDRLPENDDIVVVIASGKVGNITLVNAFELATYSIDEGWILEMWPEWEDPKVTYWMPLPQPPEGE